MGKPRLVAERNWDVVPGKAISGVMEGAVPDAADIEMRSDAGAGRSVAVGASRSEHTLRVVTVERLDRIRKAIGVEVVEDQSKLASILNAMDGAEEQTKKILRAGIYLGRELNVMLNELSPEEGKRALRNSASLFSGWSPSNLRKMIGAATLFDSGWVDKSILPDSYSVLYELSHLDEAGIRRAAESNLISPTLSRSEAEKVWRLIGSNTACLKDGPKAGTSPDLIQEVIDIDDEIAALRVEIKKLLGKRSRAILKAKSEQRRNPQRPR